MILDFNLLQRAANDPSLPALTATVVLLNELTEGQRGGVVKWELCGGDGEGEFGKCVMAGGW